jgi:hypothetical protein
MPTTTEPMTAKELLLAQAPRWSEDDAEVVLRAVEDKRRAETGDLVDEWDDFSAMNPASTARTMPQLGEEEAAPGHEPW